MIAAKTKETPKQNLKIKLFTIKLHSTVIMISMDDKINVFIKMECRYTATLKYVIENKFDRYALTH